MKLSEAVTEFFRGVAADQLEIYNEFSLQHELGIYLRSITAPSLRVQFERPAGFFEIQTKPLLKKEIDIAIFSEDERRKLALELKFPRNGQHPQQMFKACIDIAFLEQLAAGGFDGGLFVIAAEDPLFFRGDAKTQIYRYFRLGEPVHGQIRQPTAAGNQIIHIDGSYLVRWTPAGNRLHYACVVIGEDGDLIASTPPAATHKR